MTYRTHFIGLFMLMGTVLSAQDLGSPAGCDCPTVRLDDDFCASSAVFQGVALRSDTMWSMEAPDRYDPNVGGRVSTVFHVERMLKGPQVKEVTVLTGMRADDCAFNFVTGQGYLVFARREGKVLNTHQCTHTRALDTVSESMLDSLSQVFAGKSWEGGVPVDSPCP